MFRLVDVTLFGKKSTADTHTFIVIILRALVAEANSAKARHRSSLWKMSDVFMSRLLAVVMVSYFFKQVWFPRVEKALWSAYCDEGKLTAFCSYQHLNKF